MKKIILLILIILLFNITVNSQQLTLSLDEAVKLAQVNNLDIKAEKLGLNAEKWAVATCWNVFIPDVSMSANLTQMNQSYNNGRYDYWIDYFEENYNMKAEDIKDNENFKNAIEKEPKGFVTAKINVNFTFTASMIFDVYQSVLNYKKKAISTEMAQKQIILGIKKNYYLLVLIKEDINILKNNVEAVKTRFELAEKKYKADLFWSAFF